MSQDTGRLNRLAKRAKQLDDVIKKAAEMQKAIVEKIRQIGISDRLDSRRPTRTPGRKKKPLGFLRDGRMRVHAAGVVLGAGLGGFIDGITLHQIMQWHNMGSAVLPPDTMEAMSRNMVWDGWFHAATLLVTLTGVFLLWREGTAGMAPESGGMLVGQMLFGWGAFNLVEGVVIHHLLNIHHVRDMPMHVPMYDWLFLAIGGLGFLALGAAMVITFTNRRTLLAASVIRAVMRVSGTCPASLMFTRGSHQFEEMTHMESIEIGSDEVVPLDAVAQEVVGVRILFVNVFAVGDGDRWTLVMPGCMVPRGESRLGPRGTSARGRRTRSF